jgi:hypothetical protein
LVACEPLFDAGKYDLTVELLVHSTDALDEGHIRALGANAIALGKETP